MKKLLVILITLIAISGCRQEGVRLERLKDTPPIVAEGKVGPPTILELYTYLDCVICDEDVKFITFYYSYDHDLITDSTFLANKERITKYYTRRLIKTEELREYLEKEFIFQFVYRYSQSSDKEFMNMLIFPRDYRDSIK